MDDMATVIGVRFKRAGKVYYFNPGDLPVCGGDAVVVETARGLEYCEAVTPPRDVPDEQIVPPLRQVVRLATDQDTRTAAANEENERKARDICQEKIAIHNLEMKLVDVEYTFDNSKIIFYFTANGRVDFRALVKDLAAVFRTRIELRQIGVRDEAKMLGGLGPCGRQICCGAFLGDFQPVSIKMAKEQNLSLNPTKISGLCGRLMCCLKYEQDTYEQIRKRMPRVGKDILTPEGVGTVADINVLKETVRVRLSKVDGMEMKEFAIDTCTKPTAEQSSAARSDREYNAAQQEQRRRAREEEAQARANKRAARTGGRRWGNTPVQGTDGAAPIPEDAPEGASEEALVEETFLDSDELDVDVALLEAEEYDEERFSD
jgi:cell fate regulator YaaT (PSP1 superfamily)